MSCAKQRYGGGGVRLADGTSKRGLRMAVQEEGQEKEKEEEEEQEGRRRRRV